jgi:hypothetical protein
MPPRNPPPTKPQRLPRVTRRTLPVRLLGAKLARELDQDLGRALVLGRHDREVLNQIRSQPFACLGRVTDLLMKHVMEEARRTLDHLKRDPAAARGNPYAAQGLHEVRSALVKVAERLHLRLSGAIKNGVLSMSQQDLDEARLKSLRRCHRRLTREYPTLERHFDASSRAIVEAVINRTRAKDKTAKQSVSKKLSSEDRKQRALLKHHQFDGESCLEWTPIRVKDMAAQLGLSNAVISDFFRRRFRGHRRYRDVCHRESGHRLVAVLRSMCGAHGTLWMVDAVL